MRLTGVGMFLVLASGLAAIEHADAATPVQAAANKSATSRTASSQGTEKKAGKTAKEESVPAVALDAEPHHKLVFRNAQVQVYQLDLKPREATALHSHPSFYLYLSLKPATLSNEVPEHAAVISQIAPYELRMSRGGFDVVERNTSTEDAEIFVVVPGKVEEAQFDPPELGLHDAAIGEFYPSMVTHAYSLAIGAGGRVDEFMEPYDCLVLAMGDADIRETTRGTTVAEWKMQPGEIHWVTKGTTHSLINAGKTPASLLVLAFHGLTSK